MLVNWRGVAMLNSCLWNLHFRKSASNLKGKFCCRHRCLSIPEEFVGPFRRGPRSREPKTPFWVSVYQCTPSYWGPAEDWTPLAADQSFQAHSASKARTIPFSSFRPCPASRQESPWSGSLGLSPVFFSWALREKFFIRRSSRPISWTPFLYLPCLFLFHPPFSLPGGT